MPKLAAKTTTVVTTELKLKPSVQRKLMNELKGYANVHAEAVALKRVGDEHRKTILEMEEEIGEKKFKIQGFSVALVTDAEDVRLSKEKVIKRLVNDGHYSAKAAIALLEDCTTRKPKKPFATIRVPGDKEEDENG